MKLVIEIDAFNNEEGPIDFYFRSRFDQNCTQSIGDRMATEKEVQQIVKLAELEKEINELFLSKFH